MSKQKPIGKRGLFLGIMILVLGAAVYLNWQVNKKEAVTGTDTVNGSVVGQAVYVGSSSVSESDEYFVSARAERENARKKALAELKEIINNVKADANEVANATSESTAICKTIETESNIETLIKAKGFSDCLAVISGDSVNVIVKTKGLLPSDTMQIQEIVQANGGFSAENIKIIEVK